MSRQPDDDHLLAGEPFGFMVEPVGSCPSTVFHAFAVRKVSQTGSARKLLEFAAVKKLVELLLCIVHPVAVVLIWRSLLAGSGPEGRGVRLAWGISSMIPIVPFLYVLTGHDFL
jgi:hypothetical protein